MKISVIIPTHNRADILKTCLERLALQQGVDFEVIVVDDASTDSTETLMSAVLDPSSKLGMTNKLQYIKQAKTHQGVARNRGVEVAIGDIVLFIGDDIFVEPGYLQKHLEAHLRHSEENVVVLGYTAWDSTLEVNDYMRFLDTSGWQFGYNFLQSGFVDREDRYKFFYTSNISMKKAFFEKERFDEQFKEYGWEDIELGYRLMKNHGMKLFYEPGAKAFHHHLLLPSSLPQKMQAVGKSAVHFEVLHPHVRVVPRGLKKMIIKIATNPITLPLGRLLGKRFYYKLKSWSEFFKGVSQA